MIYARAMFILFNWQRLALFPVGCPSTALLKLQPVVNTMRWPVQIGKQLLGIAGRLVVYSNGKNRPALARHA